MSTMDASHVVQIRRNMDEVERLMEIHSLVAGSGPGQKRNVQVLNKSAIILLLACWEAYIEDLAENAFNFMLENAASPEVFPEHVLGIAAKNLKKGPPEAIWRLADAGWKLSLKEHKDDILQKYIVKGSFNTPSRKNIDRLFSELIGLTSISKEWRWPGISNETASKKLEDLIDLRGEIAHRVEASKSVYKKDVLEYRAFIGRIGTIMHNRTLTFLRNKTGRQPWKKYKYGKTT